MPRFSDIGTILRDKFNGATFVTISNDGMSLINADHNFNHGTLKPISVQDLVYSTRSPDYCEPDRKVGSMGTKGRKCDPESKGTEGCDLMCCGRGYKTFKVKVTENCHCKFKWCCEVNCDICDVIKTIHVCK
jgi:wingless-type MMTV integration site family protein 6